MLRLKKITKSKRRKRDNDDVELQWTITAISMESKLDGTAINVHKTKNLLNMQIYAMSRLMLLTPS